MNDRNPDRLRAVRAVLNSLSSVKQRIPPRWLRDAIIVAAVAGFVLLGFLIFR